MYIDPSGSKMIFMVPFSLIPTRSCIKKLYIKNPKITLPDILGHRQEGVMAADKMIETKLLC